MPAPVDASAVSETLAGLVERVTFHNPDNGFCVLRVKARGQRDLVTVVGHAPTISAGEFVQAIGHLDQRPHATGLSSRRASCARRHPRRSRASRSISAPA